jgi:hypothetical protein
MWWNRTLISPGERERATMPSATYRLIMGMLRVMPYPRALNSPSTCGITCAVVGPFGNKSGCMRVLCLGVNGLALALILLANLFLV